MIESCTLYKLLYVHNLQGCSSITTQLLLFSSLFLIVSFNQYVLLVTGTKDDSESDFPSEVDKEEWEEEQKV